MNLQGTEAWAQERCGFVTASCFADVLAKGQGKTRAAYMRRVVAERLTGKPAETFRNGDTYRGQVQEPHSKLAFEAETGEPIINVGFIKHPTLPRIGCSPDGLLGDDGGIEAKCVIPTVQMDTWEAGGYPSTHRAQIQGNLWITGRKFWNFISFSPDMPAHLRLYVFRVERDEAYIDNLEREVLAFDAEAEKLYTRFMTMGTPLEDLLKKSLKVAA